LLGACQSLLLGDTPDKAGPPSSTAPASKTLAQTPVSKKSVLVHSRTDNSTKEITLSGENPKAETTKNASQSKASNASAEQPKQDAVTEISGFFKQIFGTQSSNATASTDTKKQTPTSNKAANDYEPPTKLDTAQDTADKPKEATSTEGLTAKRIERRYSAAYGVYQPLATKGHAFAQYEIGLMYLHGYGVTNDTAAAEQWFRKAALQGHPDAKTELRKLIGVSSTSVAIASEATGVKEPPNTTNEPVADRLAENTATDALKLIAPKKKAPSEEEPPTILITSKSVTTEPTKPDDEEVTVIDRILPRQNLPDFKKSPDQADLTKETGNLISGLFGDGKKAPPPPNADDPRADPAPVKAPIGQVEAETPTKKKSALKKIIGDKPAKQHREAPAQETTATDLPTPAPPVKTSAAPPLAVGGVVLVEPKPVIADAVTYSQAAEKSPEDTARTTNSVNGEKDSAATFSKGLEAYNAGQFKKAHSYWHPLAQKGEAESQTRMGYLFEHGKGVERNYQQAVDWYQKAATQGEPAAQFNLGVMYRKGRGVIKDDKVARQWYEKAAGQGHPIAERVVEVMKAYKIGE